MSKITWTLRSFQLDELTDYYKNPRSLSEKEFKQLKTSLDKFGMIDKPIVNADSAHTIIGGHQRKHVLESTGVKEVECWIPDRELSDKEVEELNIRLNKNTGSWDFDTLANEFELDDLLDWGFDKSELDLDLWADEPPEDVEPQIDKAEELRVKWGVESGQLWKLGEHRLICGDCTDKAVVERVMGQDKAELVITDPPYGIEYESSTLETTKIIGDDKNIATYLGFVDDCEKETPFYIFCDFRSYPFVYLFCENKKRPICDVIVWDKTEGLERVQVPPMTLMRWIRSHEFIAYSGKLKENLGYSPDVLHYARVYGANSKKEHDPFIKDQTEKLSLIHPTIKPLAILEKCIGAHDHKIIYDPYLGSGTTLIACELLGRKCRAVEISPAYVAVAIQRWVDVTGGTPELVD